MGKNRLTTSIAIILGLMALGLLGGGAWLVTLGGSPFYAVAGAVLAAVAVLLYRASTLAWWVYAALLLTTLVWSLWEVGLDWWGLAARGDVFFVVAVVLLTPWVARRLVEARPLAPVRDGDLGSRRRFGWRGGRGALAAVTVLYLGVGVVTAVVDPHSTQGSLPENRGTATAPDPERIPPGEWHAYGRTGHGQRYAPLAEINVDNVDRLEEAWHFHTGDQRGQPGDPEETTFQVTPLKVGDMLYLCTPHQFVIALDATTGEERWRFDPKIRSGLALQHLTCRGLSYWSSDGTPPPASGPAAERPTATQAALPAPPLPVAADESPATDNCLRMLYMPTADGRIIALDPETGAVCRNFGAGSGQINLWHGMPNVRLGGYYSTSPVIASQKVLVVGGTVLDNVSTSEPSGVIRGFDVQTGELLWHWDPARPDDNTPLQAGQTYSESSPNVWSIMSVDEALGLVYLPMGNPPPDQWGGNRSEAIERVGSSVVALDLATGRLRWVFQTVHHDLWDYDVPSQPTLVDLTLNGATVPALVQPTKQGELFVLDRRTGRPVHAVQEVPVPQGAAEGDRTAPTQPVSAISFGPPPLTGASMWGATLFDQLACRIAFDKLRYEGRYTPPSTQGTLVHPGNFGVFNWGGIAVDPVRQVAFTTPTYLAFTSQLVPRPDDTSLIVQDGGPPEGALPALNENLGAPFAVKMAPFTSALGLPCQAPPWGFVAGVDLVSGEVVWQHRNGTVRDVAPIPLPFRMGVPNLGGPLITAGGVAFLSGTLDNYIRAYDLTTGDQLWQGRLPAGGQATPMSYTGRDGRQYIVVAAGGHGSLGTKAGDSVIAYALPSVAPAR
ncbi:membrane-bound PQQ-dependent dehydrogenase, glucose/quinate/shikimate family [Hydrogenophaga sp.]|uniref:membrane-bound PQQ-dependent dehydrogenase, glucose/quinate/shikimate family n=1 Tax=Hydrogenophaga sp. TaxID=1904254 RepID=UPI003F71F3B0